ncbi:MAG: Calx-beta domain-containing protein [Planctomycetota bacterium]
MAPWRIGLILGICTWGFVVADEAAGQAPLPSGALKQRLTTLAPAGQARAMARLATNPTLKAHHAQLCAESHGGLYFAGCPAAAPPASPPPAPPASASLRLAPQAAPPIYRSRPGATNQLVIDFTGGTVSGTAWNQSVADGGVGRDPIVAVGFDLDGDPATFNATEQIFIQRVWARVSEDYAPFDIDVTTAIPAAWTANTVRVLVTKSIDSGGGDNPAKTGGGVAFVGTFADTSIVTGTTQAWQYFSPAWVYYDNLPNYTSGSTQPPIADYVAEAVAHEAGHNLGLSHEGVTGGSAYYSGHGSGATSWAPIMGAAYDREITQWAHGEYASANNHEDQLAIIASYLGYQPQDRGGLIATATNLVVGSGTITPGNAANAGLIGRTDEIDVYRFDAGAGAITINLTPVSLGSNTRGCDLNIRAQILAVDGTLLTTVDPVGDPAATVSLTLAHPGYHYLRVTGGSEGTPSTGFSTYASLGAYAITGSITTNGAGALACASSTAQVFRPSSGATNLSLTLRRLSGSSGSVSVSWMTHDGSAVAGTDYTTSGGTVTWSDHDASEQTITVPILANAAPSGASTFTVSLSSPSGGAALGGVIITTVTIDPVTTPTGTTPASTTSNSSGGGGGGCGGGALGATLLLLGSFVLRLRSSFNRRV